MSLPISFVTGLVALVLVGVDSVPAIKNIADRIFHKSQYDEFSLAKTAYRDADGEATKESLKAFSDKWQRVAIVLFSASGLSVSLALAIVATLKFNSIDPLLHWLQFGIWVGR